MPPLKKEDQHSKIRGVLKKSSRAQFLENNKCPRIFHYHELLTLPKKITLLVSKMI